MELTGNEERWEEAETEEGQGTENIVSSGRRVVNARNGEFIGCFGNNCRPYGGREIGDVIKLGATLIVRVA